MNTLECYEWQPMIGGKGTCRNCGKMSNEHRPEAEAASPSAEALDDENYVEPPSPEIWKGLPATRDRPSVEAHRAEQDETMTIADGISRCVCGRTIAEVGTVNDRRWLHVEEPWTRAASPSVQALDRDALVEAVAAALSDESWQDEGIEVPLPDLLGDSILYHAARLSEAPTMTSVMPGGYCPCAGDCHHSENPCCIACLARGPSAVPSAEALDVDTLIATIHSVDQKIAAENPKLRAIADPKHDETREAWAKALAAEYARLSEDRP